MLFDVKVEQVNYQHRELCAFNGADLEVQQSAFGRGDVSPWLSLSIVPALYAVISLWAYRLIKPDTN